jgi:hypothetical protein
VLLDLSERSFVYRFNNVYRRRNGYESELTVQKLIENE